MRQRGDYATLALPEFVPEPKLDARVALQRAARVPDDDLADALPSPRAGAPLRRTLGRRSRGPFRPRSSAGVWLTMSFVPGQPDMDRETEAIPVAMMMPRELDDDVARDDSIEVALEFAGAQLDVSAEGIRVLHMSKRELQERTLHRELPLGLSVADSVQAGLAVARVVLHLGRCLLQE